MSWNLPPGCTDYQIDMAAGGYDEPDDEPDELVDEPEPPEELQAQWDAADEGDTRFTHDYEEEAA